MRTSRADPPDGVVPLGPWSAERAALGTRCVLRALVPEPGGAGTDAVDPEDVLELLDDLDRAWGPDGELDRLAGCPPGRPTEIGWDTVLLLGRCVTAGLEVDVAGHAVTRTGPVVLPDAQARQALAAELLCSELMDAGALAVRVDVGAFRSTANRGIRDPFADRSAT